MKLSNLVLTCVLAMSPFLASARADAATGPQTAACRRDLATAARRHFEGTLTARLRCRSRVAAGRLAPTTECTSGRGDIKLERALTHFEDDLESALSRSCPAEVLAEFDFAARCPDASGGQFDARDLAFCFMEGTAAIEESLLRTYFPTSGGFVRGAGANCVRRLAAGASAGFQREVVARHRCLLERAGSDAADRLACYEQIPPFGPGTGDADIDAGIQRALEVVFGSVASSCAQVSLDDLGWPAVCRDPAGGVFTVTDLQSCLYDLHGEATRDFLDLVAASEACGNGVLDAGEQCDSGAGTGACGDGRACTSDCTCARVCPQTAELVLHGPLGGACTTDADCPVGDCSVELGRCTTPSRIDIGRSGAGLDLEMHESTQWKVGLDCASTSAPCGECSVTGLAAGSDHCRCEGDGGASCAAASEADAADCGGAACVCYAGAPFPVVAGGGPYCFVTRFIDDPSGTVDIDLGEVSLNTNLNTRIYFGRGVDSPCPICAGRCSKDPDLVCTKESECPRGHCSFDPVAEDGARGGVCVGGRAAGGACDVTAVNASFPKGHDGSVGVGFSLDCLPLQAANVSGAGLPLDLVLSTATTQIPDSLFCGDDSLWSAPNRCSDGLCEDIGDGEGRCPDVDRFCDGILRLNGRGALTCDSDADCEAFEGDGLQPGSCTLRERRRCHLSPIVAEGSTDPLLPTLAAVGCLPNTGKAAFDASYGLPGPVRLVTTAELTTFCADDPSRAYVPGSGGCAD